MSKTRIKKTASKFPVPATRAEMETLIGQIASRKREEALAKTEMDERVAVVKAEYAEILTTLDAEVKALTAAAEAWSSANPDAFGKFKSIKFLAGTAGFRTGTPKLEPLNKKWNWQTITAAVCRLLPNFVRNKPEVDKESIIAQRDELAEFLPLVGLKVSQDEGFFVDVDVTPVETRETLEAK